MTNLKEAAEKLVAKLENIHNDPAYKSVWNIYHIHGFHYEGPTYNIELDELKAALENENARS